MIIPKRDVQGFANEVISRCTASREKRLARGKVYRDIYLTGDSTGDPQTFNKTQLHIDRQSSWTYSPSALRFTMDADGDVSPTERAMGVRAVDELYKYIRRGNVDRAAKEANRWSRIKGKSFIKLRWARNGLEADVIQPEAMGVEREDLTRLEDQKAFIHSTWYTIDGFVNLISTHEAAEREKLIRKAAALAKASNADKNPSTQNMMSVMLGGMYPYKDGSTGVSSQQGQVDWLKAPSPYLSPELAARILQVDELWVWDDERPNPKGDDGYGDWTVFTVLSGAGDDNFIDGKYRHRNIFADALDWNDKSKKGRINAANPLAGETPFIEFCPRPLDGYFWGISDIASVALLQRGINRRINGINDILRRQENPPRAYIGFSGVNQNTVARLSKPGGWMTESSPTGKIQDLQPELPKGLWESLDKLIQYFDDIGGVTATMGGQGDAGIRSNVHADTLLRTAGANLRDQAIEIERSISELGNLSMNILKTQCAYQLTAWVRKSEAGLESAASEPQSVEEAPVRDLVPSHFLLSDLSDQLYVTVDCHSSSPLFIQDQETLLLELKKLGAIDNKSLIKGLHPPREQEILDAVELVEVQKSEMIQQHPEILTKGKKK